MATQALNGRAHLFSGGRTGTGHARHRNVIHKARAASQDGRQAHVVRGWRGQADKVQARCLRRVAQLAVVLWRHVDHDQAIDARLFGFGNKTRHAIVVDRVEIAHQHQRSVVVTGTKLTNHLQGFCQVLLGAQRTDVGQLNRRAVGHRIGEGHAQLDHIGTRRRQALEDRQRSVVIRVTGRDKGHQRCAVLFLECGKARLQAAHQCCSC